MTNETFEDGYMPCPFCGEAPIVTLIKYDTDNSINLYRLECVSPDCDVNPATSWHTCKADAIDAWERRH